MNLSEVRSRPLQPRQSQGLNKYNIVIVNDYGLSDRTGYWTLSFTFDYELEKEIGVHLTNFKYSSGVHQGSCIWTLEVTKCHYLGITSDENMASLDMVDELINADELKRLHMLSNTKEKLREYLEANVVPLVTKKIKYTRFKPQFNFFLSHKTKDKPLMRTFENGLKFLGYETWIDQSNMPMGATLQAALKTSVDQCDCLVAWLTKEYMESDYCKAELLYAKEIGRIIIPFGSMDEIRPFLIDDFAFLLHTFIYDPTSSSFFEVLRRIDDALFNFEKLPL
jgi:hypothetical protein